MTFLSKLILLFFLCSWLTPPLRAVGPSLLAIDINKRLQIVYQDLLEKEGQPISLSSDVDTLTKNLIQLQDLDPEIRALGPGFNDGFLRSQANLYRAMAWLHGWAVFGRLAVESSDSRTTADVRDRLIALTSTSTKPSALKLLLTVYHQIRLEDGSSEPLRHVLQNGALFALALSYHEAWHNDRPTNIQHGYYIPSSADIVGTPNASPSLDRHLITLWGLINLELDTWQSLTTQDFSSEAVTILAHHPLTLRRPDGTSGRLQANNISFSPLLSWLSDMQANPDLPSLQDPGSTIVSGLLLRLQKISAFLTVRQEYADEQKLTSVLTRLSPVTQKANFEISSVIGNLISAATPIEESGKQEVLYDAAIWLRYLMLLAYRNQGDFAVANTSNALNSIWATYKLPQSFVLESPTAKSNTSSKMPFLRWNSWPAKGSSSALLFDVTRAGYAYLQFSHAVSGKEDTRFKSLGDRQAQADYTRYLGQSIEALKKSSINVLSPYFKTHSSSALSAESLTPSSLVEPDAKQAYAFRLTTNSNEQTRWVDGVGP